IAAELREVVLELKRLVAQLVVRREWLGAERRIGDSASIEDVDEGKQLVQGAAALVLAGQSSDETVRHAVADDRIPFANARADVFENRVVRILEAQEIRVGRGSRIPSEPQRRRIRQLDIR